jgi:hypothetical protein
MLLNISGLLYRISFKLRSLSLYYELKHYITNKQTYIKFTNSHDRNIGKTYNIIKLAIKYKCPIFVSNNGMKKFLLDTARDEFNKNITVYILSKDSRNEMWRKRNQPLALIEEGTIDEGADDFINRYELTSYYKCIIGYKNLH